jgi:hypothetical protein
MSFYGLRRMDELTGRSPLTLQSALVPQGLGWHGFVLTGAWRVRPMLFDARRFGIETGLAGFGPRRL